MLEIVIALKALTEVAGFALLGQGIVYVFAGAGAEKNVPYLILKTVTSPIFALARLVAPRFVPERFIWMLTPGLVILLWLVFTYLKIRLVLTGG